MKNTLKAAISLILPLCFIGGLEAGWNTHSLKDLDISVEYRGYDYLRGAQPVYHFGDLVQVRVVIHNHGNRPFKNFPVKASLSWADDVVCTRFWDDNQAAHNVYGQMLPGKSVLGPYYLTIGSDSYSFFDVFYSIPNTVCPNANVRIELDAGKDNDKHPLVLPQTFRIIE